MKSRIEQLFDKQPTWTRAELSRELGLADRKVRDIIRAARKKGVPIMALQTGGYKLAETEAEMQQLLHMYEGRALDELGTYYALRRTLVPDGQLSLEECEA